MFTGLLIAGGIGGLGLFAGKFIIYKIIMQIFPARLEAWIYRTPIAMILLDFGFAGLASPIASMAGGTIAMFTMITYGLLCAIYIGIRLAIAKTKRWYENISERSEAWTF